MPSSAITTVAAREQDRAPGGVHRLHDRLARVPERRAGRRVGLAEAREDEQRVVDPDAEADHRRELGGEVGRVDDVREQARSAPSPVPRPNSAVTIGRPIAISEPNVSSSTTIAASSPTALEMPKLGLLGLLDRLAAELDLQAGAAARPSPCRPRAPRRSWRGRSPSRRRRRSRTRSCRRPRSTFPAATPLRADDRGDVRQLGDAGEHRAHPRAHGGVAHGAAADLVDDRVAVARLRREARARAGRRRAARRSWAA